MANGVTFIVRDCKTGNYYCRVCDTLVDEYCSLELHLNDKYHSDALTSSSSDISILENGTYYCFRCNYKISRCSDVYRHLAGRLHSSGLKIVNWNPSKTFVSPFVVKAIKNNREVHKCLICNCLIAKEQSLVAHVSEKRHSYALDEERFNILLLENNCFYCILCDIVMTQYEAIYPHVTEEKHFSSTRKFFDKRIGRSANWRTFVCPFVIMEGSELYYCMICDCWTRTRSTFLLHAITEKHVNAVKHNEPNVIPLEDNYYYCKLCDIVIPDHKNVHLHVAGQKHCDSLSLRDDWIVRKNFFPPFVRQTDESGFYCVICDETIRSLLSLKAHTDEASHIDGVNNNIDSLLPFGTSHYRCEICDCIIPDNKKVRSHLLGNRHNAGLRCLTQNSLTKTEPVLAKPIEWSLKDNCVKPFVSRENESKFYCMLCNCFINNHKIVEIHVDSAAHKSALEKQRSFISPLNNPFYHCNLCDFYIVNHKSINKHLRDEKHISLLATMKFEEEKDEKRMRVEINVNESMNDELCSQSTQNDMNFGKSEDNRDAEEKCENPREPSTNETKVENRSDISHSTESFRQIDDGKAVVTHHRNEGALMDNSNLPVSIDAIFTMINEELASLYEQLRLNDNPQIESHTDAAIARWLKIFSGKNPSDDSASARLDYLTGLLGLLYEDLKVDTNTRGKTGNCFNITRSQLNMKILSFLEEKMNRAKESRDSIDSGNEDISRLTSTSSIHIEYIDNKQRGNKTYWERVAEFLNFNEDIYDMSEKTRKMLLGMNLRFVINSTSDYCLVCRIIVSNSLNKCLEHLSNPEHMKYLEKIEKNHLELFPSMYGSFSELSLAHEYIEILSENATRCLVCRKEMGNDDSILVQHFDDNDHRNLWEKMRSRAKKNIDLVAAEIQCDWYSVQKYECLPCSKTFDFEIDFVGHLLYNERHSNNVEKMLNNGEPRMIYDYCAACALLWCVCPNGPNNHRESRTHKWFVENGPLLNTEFPESARNLLNSWEIENFNILDVMNEIERDCRSSIVRAHEKGTGHDRNLSFGSQSPIEDVKFFILFNKICPSSAKMITFLKEWLKKCDLAGIQQISSVALYWYVILYLQTVSVLPAVASLNTMKMFWRELADWEDFSMLKQQSFDLKQHIIGFFTLYANFDYRYDVACPLLGKVIEKRSFADDTNGLPEEMGSYVTYMSNTKYAEPFKIDSVMCLQDPFDLQYNLTQHVKKIDLSRFRIFCCHSLSILCTSEI